jgi:hypothetical protein
VITTKLTSVLVPVFKIGFILRGCGLIVPPFPASRLEVLQPLAISKRFIEYFRCPERYGSFAVETPFSEAGYFEFNEKILFGRRSDGESEESPAAPTVILQPEFSPENHSVPLPFDADEVIDNLRLERYVSSAQQAHPVNSLVGRVYYSVRPLLPVRLRRHLQKARLSGWRDLKFPQWPVDRTVDHTMNDLLLISRRAHGIDKVPFIWFWPEGATAAAVVTHDVETDLGWDSCAMTMDIDDSFGFTGSFQIVPEKRYEVTPACIDSIWNRGFEVAVHDLNHDGHLFRNRETFLQRAAKINVYGKHFQAQGFRAAVLYRNQEWYDALDFSYDSSVPNVAHLDPQRGGCCTVMPYFIGKLVELPVTTTQDYSLYHMLNDYSINLWKQQIDLILESHGLINVIIHPDYSLRPRERAVFEALLSHLAKLRDESGVWTALPKDIARWWRQRSEMKLVEDENGLRIEGEGKERARIAYALEKDGRLVFEVCPTQACCVVENSN